MSEDIRCVNCFHRSHENKPCINCPADTPQNPNIRCKEFVRADLFMARSMARIESYLGQGHGQMMAALSTIFDLLTEAYPEAAESMKRKLEERHKLAEEKMEKQRIKALAEADAALAEAKLAQDDRDMAELAENYTKTNVLQFPKSSVEEVEGNTSEDNDPEAV